MARLFDLLTSYLLVGGGFGLLGFTTYGWLHPTHVTVITTDRQLVGGTLGFVLVALVLIALVVIGIGVHWHAAATRAIASFDRISKDE